MLFALLWIAAPSVDDIVSKSALSFRPVTHAVCQSETEQLRLGGHDAVVARERAAFVRTYERGTYSDAAPSKRWKDDEALSDEQVTTINGRATTPRDDTLDRKLTSPLLDAVAHAFTLQREDTLWGHKVYVLHVAAKTDKGSNGTLWIDAESFVELKGELTPQSPPSNVDSLSWQEQFMPLGDGVARTLIHIEGRGHFLFFRAATRFTERVVSCAP